MRAADINGIGGVEHDVIVTGIQANGFRVKSIQVTLEYSMKSIRKQQLGLIPVILLIAVVAALLGAAYTWVMLTWSYSTGERAGFVQKLSKKGYICKTWEGEQVLVSMPGTQAEKFYFTVRDEAVAKRINDAVGKRVNLYYEQHIWLPTNCFGDTEYFVQNVEVLDK